MEETEAAKYRKELAEVLKTAEPNEGYSEPELHCGECAYYKTPKCEYSYFQAVIKKKDGSCCEFYPDRHLFSGFRVKSRKKGKRVEYVRG